MRDAETLRKLTADLVEIYSAAEISMLRKLASRLARGIESSGWAERKLEEIYVLRDELEFIMRDTNKAGVDEAERAVRQAFRYGRNAASADTGLGLATGTNAPALLTHVEAARKAVKVPGTRVVDQLVTVYQRAAAVGTTQVLTGTTARLAASQGVVDDLVSQGITAFTGRDGRRWSLRAYTEMAVRTQSANAAVAGHSAELLAYDIKLVRITSHPDSCPVCAPWQGRVLSIGGAPYNQYPELGEAQAAGLYHPNCRHAQAAYIPGITRAAPEVQKFDAKASAARVEQRRLERGIRYWKHRQAVALTDDAAASAGKSVRLWQSKLRAHVSANDLKRLRYREQ